jgi:hypothetical protein
MAAIYMWFDPEAQVWTTTLYPVEIIDSLGLSVSVTGGGMGVVEGDEYDTTGILQSFEREEIVIFGPVPDDEYDTSGQLLSFVVEELLIEGPEPADEYDTSGVLLSFEHENLLVTVDTPDEQLQLACDVNPVDCSMTPV